MTHGQIQQLIADGKFPFNQSCTELQQTHISWIILCQDYAYKIKKPVNLSFLDFSTLEKRKYFCQQEVSLNQRLTHDIYLDVLPITLNQGQYMIGLGTGLVVDYAVMMRRLDNSKEMSKLLVSGEVRKSDIRKIASQLVEFHQKTEIVKGVLTPKVLIEDFNDIEQTQPFIKKYLGQSASKKLSNIISFVQQLIEKKAALILNRDKQGLTRDCHGDLHSGNIFLLDNPVIFDCIEFDEHLRKIDVLNELAFFCMDLEFYQRSDLSDYFLRTYNDKFNVIRDKDEEQLFLFYKLYRANVKAKINGIKTVQGSDPHEIKSRLILFKKYFQLLLDYFSRLQNSENSQ